MSDEAVFNEARSITIPAKRAAFLRERCGSDEAMRARVEALLIADQRPDSLLDDPVALDRLTVDFATARPRPGDNIGQYKLREQIGEGGFGIVYVAEQVKPVRRKVALKIIKPGMDTREVVARFEAERQALALMDHPNVARVLDVGTTGQGHPYFVMELIHGAPITEYCDKNKMPTNERLALFLDVCRAVQHAHQKGIIHRDLKPNNVIVTLHDGRPVPKVIDFGVAKALSQQLTEKTIYTRYGSMVGTPAYMSPEQAEVSGLGIDTRSDIYSLGVLLYQLLTSKTPHDSKSLRERGYDEMLRIIREEDPPRPSVKISSLGQEATLIAAHRQTDIRKLSQSLSGELDWIIMKSLEKDRNQRYETANHFAADVERFLNDEAVQACPPSTIYRLRKLMRRYRGQFVTAATLLVVLCIGLVGTGIGLVMATKEASRARLAEVSEKRLASANRTLADEERRLRMQAETALRVATAKGLAGYAQSLRDVIPERSLLLAREAVATTWQHDKTVAPIAHQSLWNTMADFGGRPLAGHQGAIRTLTFSPNGKWLVTGSLDHTARLWDLTKVDPASSPSVVTLNALIDWVGISANSRWLIVHSGGIRTQRGEAFLWDLTAPNPEKASVPLPQKEGVKHAALSQNRRWLATGSSDGTVRRWDLEADDPTTTALVLRLEGDDLEEEPPGDYLPIQVAVSNNGRFLASLKYPVNRGIRLWDVHADPEDTRPMMLDSDKFFGPIRFSPDSRWFAVASIERNRHGMTHAGLWDLSAEIHPESVIRLPGHRIAVFTVVFDPNSHSLVTTSGDENLGTVHVWDLTRNDPSSEPRLLGHPSRATATAISPDGRWLITCGNRGQVRVWDLHSADPVATSRALRGNEGWVGTAAFSPDGRWLATGSADGISRLWAVGEQGPLHSPLELARRSDVRGQFVVELAISPSGRWLVAATHNRLRVWDMGQGTPPQAPVAQVQGHLILDDTSGDSRSKLAFSRNSRWLAAVSDHDNCAKLWNLETDSDLSHPIVFPHDHRVLSVAFSGDTRWLITGSGDGNEYDFSQPGEVRLWDLSDRTKAASPIVLRGHELPQVRLLATSANGRWLATGARGGTKVLVWDLFALTPSAPQYVLTLPKDAELRIIAMSPNDRWLAAGSVDHNVRVWELAALKPSAPVTLTGNHGNVHMLAWSSDSQRLATGGNSGTLRIWDFPTHDSQPPSLVLSGHRGSSIAGSIRTGAVSRNNRWLVTVASEPLIWDLAARDPAASAVALRIPGERLRHIVVDPGCRWIVTGGNRSIQLWDLDMESLLRRAGDLAGRELSDTERKQYLP